MKKNLVILTGAGVSAESGISTFRDNGGLWDKFDPQEVASIEGWHKNPGLMLDFYNIRRKELETVRPNAAHLEIAALQDKLNVHVITQNVDNLYLLQDTVEVEGILKGPNTSYVPAFNIEIGGSNYLKLIYFKEDVDLNAFQLDLIKMKVYSIEKN